MGKNFREQAAYDYLHDKEEKVKNRYFWSIMRKWWRHNFNIGESRRELKKLIKHQKDKDLKTDLINYYNENKQYKE